MARSTRDAIWGTILVCATAWMLALGVRAHIALEAIEAELLEQPSTAAPVPELDYIEYGADRRFRTELLIGGIGMVVLAVAAVLLAAVIRSTIWTMTAVICIAIPIIGALHAWVIGMH